MKPGDKVVCINTDSINAFKKYQELFICQKDSYFYRNIG